MKQTKKLTRNQKEFLQKKKIDAEGVRVIEEKSDYLKILKADGTVVIIEK